MKSYGNCGDTPITMDMGCFKIQYRNHLGGNRLGIFKTSTAEEARQGQPARSARDAWRNSDPFRREEHPD